MFRKLLLALFALLLLPALLLAQDGKLRGKVTDKESGEALVGANVTVEGTSLGAATDVNGEYIYPHRSRWRLYVEGDVHRLLTDDNFEHPCQLGCHHDTGLQVDELGCSGSGCRNYR